jgi:putative hydrolase of the HAD superfamily
VKNQNKPILIFDLFHTLISFKADHIPGRSTSAILGVQEDLWNHLLWNYSGRRLKQRFSDYSMILADLCAELEKQGHPKIAELTIKEAAQARAERFAANLRQPSPHRLEAVRLLSKAGFRLFLLSNADSMECAAWNLSPFAQYFEGAFFSCDIGAAKPEAEAYQIVLEAAGVGPEAALFIGDGGSSELAGAKALGIRTILTTEILAASWPEKVEARRKDADWVVSSLSEVSGIAGEWGQASRQC